MSSNAFLILFLFASREFEILSIDSTYFCSKTFIHSSFVRYSGSALGLKELKEATANELAMHLFSKKLTPFFNRNYVHPRLNELMEDNKVEVIGKKKDSITERTSAIYTLVAS